MADPQQVLSARVRDALVAAYGADYADADPLIRPSSFADFQSNAALPLAKRLGKAAARHRQRDRRATWTSPASPSRPRSAGPASSTSRCAHEWIAAPATEVARRPAARRAGDRAPADGHRRVLLAEHRQGDARRAPAHDDRRRRDRPGDRVRRPPRDPGQPRRRLGHAVRHADRAPGRRGRGLAGGGPAAHRPERLLPGARGSSSTPTRCSPTGPGSGWSSCSPATTRRRMRLWEELVEHVQGLPAGHLRPARRHADRRRHQGRVVLQRHAARRRRRPGSPRASRGSATARCARSPPGSPAGTASRCR